MKLNFRFQWYDASKTAMHYIAEKDWNWRDYHAAARASIYTMMNQTHPVHAVIDFREQTRTQLPAGLAGHMSTFGKRLSPVMSGQAIVIGMSQEDQQKLPLNDDGTMSTKDGRVYFVNDDAEAHALIASWQPVE